MRDEALKFLKKECPYETVKELEESDEGYSPQTWKKMADLGWLGLGLPEAYGGDGGPFVDLVIFQEEVGRTLFPSPFFSTVVQCGQLILEAGTEEQKQELLPEIIDGNLIMALAQYEDNGSYLIEDISMKAEPEGDYFLLNGTKMFVMDANIAHKLITVTRSEYGKVTLFLVDTDNPNLAVTKLPAIGKDNICEVSFDKVRVTGQDVLGSPGQGLGPLETVSAKAAVAKAAEMIGGCRACIDMTADYAKQRHQYGKPIGGYQVIQHYMANMLLEYDSGHSYLYRTACKVDEGETFATDASGLKACANEGLKFISERSVQIHGGIGTTREGNVALYYRKAKSYEYQCGDTDLHYENIMANLLKEKHANT
jgi:alkylation response protein AidB-like acyl-CoA dehydrogenase